VSFFAREDGEDKELQHDVDEDVASGNINIMTPANFWKRKYAFYLQLYFFVPLLPDPSRVGCFQVQADDEKSSGGGGAVFQFLAVCFSAGWTTQDASDASELLKRGKADIVW
jgi:hypothetical protein